MMTTITASGTTLTLLMIVLLMPGFLEECLVAQLQK